MIVIRESKLSESTDLSDLAVGLYHSIAKNTKRAVIEIPRLGRGKPYDISRISAMSKGVNFICDAANIMLVCDYIKISLATGYSDTIKITGLKLSNRTLAIELERGGWAKISLF